MKRLTNSECLPAFSQSNNLPVCSLRFCLVCRSSVRLTIRKIQFSPENTELAPVAEMTFEFLMSEKPLQVKLSLPKEVRMSSDVVIDDSGGTGLPQTVM